MNRNIFIWGFYDLASSMSAAALFLYFSQWYVIDRGVPDVWFNGIFVVSTLLLLVTAPILCSIADKLSNQLFYLRIVTALEFLSAFCLGVVALFFPATHSNLIFVGILFILQTYFYQFSYAFYNPMLASISDHKHVGKVSGIGGFFSGIGSITGGAVALPLAMGAVSILGHTGRGQVFLPISILFMLCSLPMLLLFKEREGGTRASINIFHEYKNFVNSFVSLMKHKGVGRFLLGYFFYIDALLTAQNNFPIYLEKVFHIPDTTKSIVLGLTIVGSATGALVMGRFSDKWGIKKTFLFVVFSWIITLPAMALASYLPLFIFFLVISGFLLGATAALARAAMLYLSPPDHLTKAFSYYALSERLSTFAGPITWGVIATAFVSLGVIRYNLALASMAIFVIAAFFIFLKVPSDK